MRIDINSPNKYENGTSSQKFLIPENFWEKKLSCFLPDCCAALFVLFLVSRLLLLLSVYQNILGNEVLRARETRTVKKMMILQENVETRDKIVEPIATTDARHSSLLFLMPLNVFFYFGQFRRKTMRKISIWQCLLSISAYILLSHWTSSHGEYLLGHMKLLVWLLCTCIYLSFVALLAAVLWESPETHCANCGFTVHGSGVREADMGQGIRTERRGWRVAGERWGRSRSGQRAASNPKRQRKPSSRGTKLK